MTPAVPGRTRGARGGAGDDERRGAAQASRCSRRKRSRVGGPTNVRTCPHSLSRTPGASYRRRPARSQPRLPVPPSGAAPARAAFASARRQRSSCSSTSLAICAKRVLVKANAGIASPPLAGLPPFDRVPFMPMLTGTGELPSVIERQSTGAVRPVGYEVPRMPLVALPPLIAAARAARGRVWANTLWDGYVAGVGGDDDALRDPQHVWGRLIDAGVSMIQTDHPAELRRFVDGGPSR